MEGPNRRVGHRRWWLLGLIAPVVIVAATVANHLTGVESDDQSDSPAPPTHSANGGVSTGRTNCAANPGGCGFPDATNTGVPRGTRLTVVNGDLTVSEAGTVVEGKDIRGCVIVKAPNVTIRRSKVTCTSFAGIASFRESYQGGGLLIEDVEIDCQHNNSTGVGSYGFVARRLNIHGCENGFDIDDTSTVEDSYMHDFYEGATGHADGIQFAGGLGSGITIRHNTIFVSGGTSAIISDATKNSDVLIIDNLFAGGAYTIYCPSESSVAYRVINNRFSTRFYEKGGAFGPWVDCEKAAEVRGNVWDHDLSPLS